MMYIPDTAGSVVHRYDPVSRVYLGSFNAQSRLVTGNSATNTVGLSVAGGLPAFYDGYTGDFLGSTTTAGAQGLLMRSSGTELLTTSGAVMRRYSAVTGSELQSTAFAGTMLNGLSFAEIGSGRIAVLGVSATGIVIQTYSSTFGYISESLVVATAGVSTAAALSSMAFVSLGGVSHLVFSYRDASNSVNLARVTMSGGITPSGAATVTTLTGYSTTSAFTTTSVMAGHNGSFFVTGLSTTGTSSRIKQMYTAGGLLTTTQDYVTSAFVAPSAGYWMGSNVVAPEPCSMLALAGGLAAMLRKRRRRQ